MPIRLTASLQSTKGLDMKTFQDTYKRLTSTGVHILLSSIYIALGWALSSLISFTMELNSD